MTSAPALPHSQPRVDTPRPGFHPVEWLCELAGTAIVLLVGLSAVCFDFGSASPLHALPTTLRFLVTGLVFAGSGSLVALTPIGRRSGAHLNPVVTLAFWAQRKVHWHDLVGYIVAQFVGAVGGTVIVRLVWQRQAVSVSDGATVPAAGVPDLVAVSLEAGMTAAVLLAILFLTSSRRTARYTPLVLWLLIAALVWQFAPVTGTSLNPARSLGPALLAPALGTYWVDVVGPLLGLVVAVAVFALARQTQVLTTKLFHDPKYPSTMATSLPTAIRRRRPRRQMST